MINNSPPIKYSENIRLSGISVYHPIDIGDPKLWIPTHDLERILDHGLVGLSLAGFPIRTRSKVAKQRICEVLGYPIPSSFKKTQPRFPGQHFDTYVQKSNNLQIWNEEISSTRRYVVIKLDANDIVTRVKVVTGDALAILDTTGTLTKKYQARCIPNDLEAELISPVDTDLLGRFTSDNVDLSNIASPVMNPIAGSIIPIASVFELLKPLIGSKFKDAGFDQERNRGAFLHRMVCKRIGYANYQDDGQFPDIRHQLLEVKLQTSPTIDLGLVLPSSLEPLDVPRLSNFQVRHCDVRYAIFYARTDGSEVKLSHLFMSTGKDFFRRFQQFQGKVTNSKIQIPLPYNFFDRDAK